MEQNDKFVEFQQELEIRKNSICGISFLDIYFLLALVVLLEPVLVYVWFKIGMIVFLEIIGLMVMHEHLKDFDMMDLYHKSVTKFLEEKSSFETMKEQYAIIVTCKVNDIMPNFRETASYLLSNNQKTPAEMLKLKEQELQDIETWQQVYLYSPERNFWQYLKSFKWIMLKTNSVKIALT